MRLVMRPLLRPLLMCAAFLCLTATSIWAGDAKEAVQHAGEKAQKWAGDAKDVAADAVGDFGREVSSLVRKHPLPSLLIGFGVGLLVGRAARMV